MRYTCYEIPTTYSYQNYNSYNSYLNILKYSFCRENLTRHAYIQININIVLKVEENIVKSITARNIHEQSGY